MSEPVHKRQRILHNSPADFSKMRTALNRLKAFKEDLDGVEGMEDISDHVLALENILKGANNPRASFSMVTEDDLKEAGVTRKRLFFEPAKVIELTECLTTDADAEIVDLHSRINRIYARVNMDSSRMILNAILLAMVEISSTQERGVVILPEMRISQGDGVQVSHPVPGYESWYVDYVIIEYEDILDNKKRLLAHTGSREAFEISKSCLLIVEAKCQSMEQSFASFIPEAVSQAIVFLKSADLQEVRFCLSDGEQWIFFILKLEDEKLTYYESTPQRLSLDDSDLPLRKIVQLLCEWLRPTKTDLFELG